MIRKFLTVLLCVFMALPIVSCGGDDDPNEPDVPDTPTGEKTGTLAYLLTITNDLLNFSTVTIESLDPVTGKTVTTTVDQNSVNALTDPKSQVPINYIKALSPLGNFDPNVYKYILVEVKSVKNGMKYNAKITWNIDQEKVNAYVDGEVLRCQNPRIISFVYGDNLLSSFSLSTGHVSVKTKENLEKYIARYTTEDKNPATISGDIKF